MFLTQDMTIHWKKIAIFSVAIVISFFSLFSVQKDIRYFFSNTFVIDYGALLLACFLLYLTNIFSTLRLQSLMKGEGWGLSFRTLHRLNMLSLLSGALFLNFIGQSLSRVETFKKHGISSSLIIKVTFAERILGALILSMLSLCSGIVFLFGDVFLLDPTVKKTLLNIMVCLLFVVPFSLFLQRSKLSFSYLKAEFFKNSFGAFFYTFLSFLSMACSYFFILKALGNNFDSFFLIIFASFIVMFLASLPISLNGWGVREYSSVFFFGLLGIQSREAFAASLLIGVLSLVVLVLSACFYYKKNANESFDTKHEATRFVQNSLSNYITKLFLFFLPLGFFITIQAMVGGVYLSMSPLDAIIVFVALLAFFEMTFPRNFLQAMFFGFLVLLSSFLIGYADFGFTSFAFNNRLIGYLILCCYLLSGFYLANVDQKQNNVLFTLSNFLIFALLICVFDVVIRWSQILSSSIIIGESRYIMQGMLANRNAFSYLILMSMSLVISYYNNFDWLKRNHFKIYIIGFFAAVLFFNGSRTGFITFFALLFFSYRMNALRLKDIAFILMSACFFIGLDWSLLFLKKFLYFFGIQISNDSYNVFFSNISHPESFTDRWRTIVDGWNMFLSSPIWGKGLGAFMNQEIKTQSSPLVIHNSFLMILAEFGLIGFALFMWIFLKLFSYGRSLLKTDRNNGLFILLSMMIFALYALPHDILYQRIHWFLLSYVVGMSLLQKKFIKTKN